VTQCKNNASAGQEAGNSINLALFQSRVQRRYFATDWLGLGTVCRFKLRFIPAQVMPEHLSHEKEIELFALGQLDIGMAPQYLIKPGRTASHRTNSDKSWQMTVFRTGTPRKVLLQ